MGKDKGGFLAPKQIANRIKARGLQKLRWFCQMCNKQCRDENGFKCHCQSESHQRQMLIFSENSTKFMDEFSKEFEDGMMEIIQRKARSQRQNANQMYKDYIANKQHFHMNATIWETLTDFIMYLGRTGGAAPAAAPRPRARRCRAPDPAVPCLLYTSPSPRDVEESRMPSSA